MHIMPQKEYARQEEGAQQRQGKLTLADGGRCKPGEQAEGYQNAQHPQRLIADEAEYQLFLPVQLPPSSAKRLKPLTLPYG